MGLAITLLASCKQKEEPVPPVTPPPVEDPAPPPTPQPQATPSTTTTTTTTTVEEKEPDGTSISLGKDGISVKNQDGDKKNNVIITNKKKEVEIKTEKN